MAVLRDCYRFYSERGRQQDLDVILEHGKNQLMEVLKNWFDTLSARHYDRWVGKFGLKKSDDTYVWHQPSYVDVYAFKWLETMNIEKGAAWKPGYDLFHEDVRPLITLGAEQVNGMNCITQLLRSCSTEVAEETVVYRLTNPLNPPMSGIRSTAVVPSSTIIPGWSGAVYKIILRKGLQVITDTLVQELYGIEFEMIVLDGLLVENPELRASDQYDENLLVVERAVAGPKRQRDGEPPISTRRRKPLYLRYV